jgi:hypothetical protein
VAASLRSSSSRLGAIIYGASQPGVAVSRGARTGSAGFSIDERRSGAYVRRSRIREFVAAVPSRSQRHLTRAESFEIGAKVLWSDANRAAEFDRPRSVHEQVSLIRTNPTDALDVFELEQCGHVERDGFVR